MTPECFLSLARYAMTPMMLLDGDGRILAVNDLFAKELSASGRSLTGKSLHDLLDVEPESTCDFLKQASRSRELHPMRCRLKPSDHVSQDLIIEAGLLAPAAERAERRLILRMQTRRDARRSFIALNQKIDELTAEIGRRRLLEEEKSRLLLAEQKARLEAEEANRFKDDFLAAISHELRTPMNVIKGWADLLQQGLLEDAEYPAVFAAISRNADHEVQLINDLLDVSRIVTNRIALRRQPVDLPDVVQSAIENMRIPAAEKEVQISLAVETDASHVAGDAERLLQAFGNILNNAIKFSHHGDPIRVLINRNGPNIEVHVKDQGVGIAPHFLPYIFDRFRQEEAGYTRCYGGLGLGLTIVRHVVEQLDGSVQARSEGKGKGTVFTISLPLLQADFPRTQALGITPEFA